MFQIPGQSVLVTRDASALAQGAPAAATASSSASAQPGAAGSDPQGAASRVAIKIERGAAAAESAAPRRRGAGAGVRVKLEKGAAPAAGAATPEAGWWWRSEGVGGAATWKRFALSSARQLERTWIAGRAGGTSVPPPSAHAAACFLPRAPRTPRCGTAVGVQHLL